MIACSGSCASTAPPQLSPESSGCSVAPGNGDAYSASAGSAPVIQNATIQPADNTPHDVGRRASCIVIAAFLGGLTRACRTGLGVTPVDVYIPEFLRTWDHRDVDGVDVILGRREIRPVQVLLTRADFNITDR